MTGLATAQSPRTWRLPDVIMVYRPTRRDVDPETGQTTAQALWSQHRWQPGACWLWCERTGVEVTWIGPVSSSGMHADLYACRHCLYHLDQRVWDDQLRKSRPTPRARAPLQGRGRHRKNGPRGGGDEDMRCSCGSSNVQQIPETRDGAIYRCGDCGTEW